MDTITLFRWHTNMSFRDPPDAKLWVNKTITPWKIYQKLHSLHNTRSDFGYTCLNLTFWGYNMKIRDICRPVTAMLTEATVYRDHQGIFNDKTDAYLE